MSGAARKLELYKNVINVGEYDIAKQSNAAQSGAMQRYAAQCDTLF
jgi:hypothetical protein